MAKILDKMLERRRYIRLDTPIEISYAINENGAVHKTMTKNISPDGLRFEGRDKGLAESDIIELKLTIPGTVNPVHVKGRVMWKKRLSLEDSAPFDFGLEFSEIEEDNKNTFLKFFCDLLYDISKEPKYDKKS